MIYGVIRKNLSWAFICKRRNYYLHLSFKNPWLIPRIDRNFNGSITLVGWLFIYFGWNNYNNEW